MLRTQHRHPGLQHRPMLGLRLLQPPQIMQHASDVASAGQSVGMLVAVLVAVGGEGLVDSDLGNSLAPLVSCRLGDVVRVRRSGVVQGGGDRVLRDVVAGGCAVLDGVHEVVEHLMSFTIGGLQRGVPESLTCVAHCHACSPDSGFSRAPPCCFK
jgi:hypothetical protein